MSTIMLITGCSNIKTTESNESNPTIETTTTITTTTEAPTPTPIEYNFQWGAAENDEFEKIFEERFNGMHLAGYVKSFGYTDELNKIFTDYVNTHYGTNYEYIPFSEVSYFRQMVISDKDNYRLFRDNYEQFTTCFMDNSYILKGSFNNKLVMSYLIQNEIPFGSRIQIDALKSIYGDKIYELGSTQYLMENTKLGNYDSSYIYSDFELYLVLRFYNYQLSDLCQDERILPQDFFTDDPEYKETIDEVIPIYNGYFKQYFGENAPQIGQVMTKEQYRAIFGEDPLDLSYIPGAVVNDTQLKGNAQVRYGDSIENYTFYAPSSTYDYYVDEPEQTGRSR